MSKIQKFKIFLRSFYISFIIFFCIFIAFIGSTKAYENIRLIGFGEHCSAIEYENGTLKIFDFELKVR